jgi:hypothetical protein
MGDALRNQRVVIVSLRDQPAPLVQLGPSSVSFSQTAKGSAWGASVDELTQARRS